MDPAKEFRVLLEGERFGWYSAEAEKHHGSFSVSRTQGPYVTVTSVSDSPTDSGTMFEDIRCIGKITGPLERKGYGESGEGIKSIAYKLGESEER